jgi:hypothetical protein
MGDYIARVIHKLLRKVIIHLPDGRATNNVNSMRSFPIPIVSDKYLPDESFLAMYSATTVKMLYNALNKTSLPDRIETPEDIAKRDIRNNHGGITQYFTTLLAL